MLCFIVERDRRRSKDDGILIKKTVIASKVERRVCRREAISIKGFLVYWLEIASSQPALQTPKAHRKDAGILIKKPSSRAKWEEMCAGAKRSQLKASGADSGLLLRSLLSNRLKLIAKTRLF